MHVLTPNFEFPYFDGFANALNLFPEFKGDNGFLLTWISNPFVTHFPDIERVS